jgi:hypothetical protein
MIPASLDPAERIRRAQERALRAARAVTFTLGATLAGCAATVSGSPAEVPAMEAGSADAGAVTATDAGAEAGAATVADAGEDVSADAGEDVSADAGESCTGDERDGGETWAQCCARLRWDWNRGCGAWGPFMPPSMEG